MNTLTSFILSESILGSTVYNAALKGNEQLFFDFYGLVRLTHIWPQLGEVKPDYGVGERSQNIEKEHSEILQQICLELKKRFLIHLPQCIAAEASHWLTMCEDVIDDKTKHFYPKALKFVDENNLKKFVRVTYDMGSNAESVADMNSVLASMKRDTASSISLFERMFTDFKWEEKYGGEPWAMACRAYKRLANSKNDSSLYIMIDNIYDLQHNTGVIFDKLMASYRWLNEELLEWRNKNKSPYEYVGLISKSLEPLFLAYLANKYSVSLEKFHSTPLKILKGK